MAKKGGKKEGGVTIIKREEVVEGGHHGGAWKVAYADFVTAMMAFFLLMWLLNATTEEQRRGIADYFAPTNPMANSSSGSGLPFGGRTPNDTGSLVSDRGAKAITPGKATAMVAPDDADADTSDQVLTPRLLNEDGDPASEQRSPTGSQTDSPTSKYDAQQMAKLAGQQNPQGGPAAAEARAEREQAEKALQKANADNARREKADFQQAADQIRAAVQADPELAGIARQLAIDVTPDGLRIQMLDEDKQPMFDFGSSSLNERAKGLLQKVAAALGKLSEPISITGHTDAAAYRGGDRTNWELSSDRANATRRLLADSGIDDTRFRGITGAADRDPLLPADPLAAANRRIAIVVLRSRPQTAAPPPPAARPAQNATPTLASPSLAPPAHPADAATPNGQPAAGAAVPR